MSLVRFIDSKSRAFFHRVQPQDVTGIYPSLMEGCSDVILAGADAAAFTAKGEPDEVHARILGKPAPAIR